jgi:hypothetical protein
MSQLQTYYAIADTVRLRERFVFIEAEITVPEHDDLDTYGAGHELSIDEINRRPDGQDLLEDWMGDRRVLAAYNMAATAQAAAQARLEKLAWALPVGSPQRWDADLKIQELSGVGRDAFETLNGPRPQPGLSVVS